MTALTVKKDRTLLVLLVIIAGLVIVALAVVFSRGEPDSLPADTPEGTVQRYAAAIVADDEPRAAEYLSARALEECYGSGYSETDNVRITLVGSTIREDTADVRVSISTSYGSGPFGGSDYEMEDAFELLRVDGEWQIDAAPWQLTVCPTASGRP